MLAPKIQVEEILERVPRQRKVKKRDYREKGMYPVVDQSRNFIGGYVDDRNYLYSGELPVIVFGDHTRILKFVDFPFCVGADGTQLLRPKPNLDIRYFYYALHGIDLSNYGYERHFKYLKKESIPVPPLPIQKRIAGILSAYDELIENNQRRIKILEEMARSLYREWFVHFRYPGHEGVPLVDSPLGPIPQGWEVKSLGDILNIRKGKSITKKTIVPGDVPVVAGGITPAYYHNAANTKHPVITISASGANAGFVNLYEEDVWASDCSFIDTDSTQHVYYYYLQFKDRQNEITHLQRGSAQPHVYPKDLMSLDAICPPGALLRLFSSKVEQAFHLMKIVYSKNKNLSQSRDLLLPKLLSGDVDVSRLEDAA